MKCPTCSGAGRVAGRRTGDYRRVGGITCWTCDGTGLVTPNWVGALIAISSAGIVAAVFGIFLW